MSEQTLPATGRAWHLEARPAGRLAPLEFALREVPIPAPGPGRSWSPTSTCRSTRTCGAGLPSSSTKSSTCSPSSSRGRRLCRHRKLHFRETVVDGLDGTLDAFLAMMRGENVGKTVVKL